MTDPAAVLRANGIVADPADVIAAASAARLPLEVMAPKLLKESYGGRNVFGNDRVAYPTSGPYTAATVEVTYEACQAYLRWRRGGTGRANGVGPAQITYHVLQDDAERRGGLHVPRVNMLVGAEEMARCLKAASGDIAEAGARYNGGDRWRNAAAAKRKQAEEYGQWLAREAARWRALLSAAASAQTPAPPPSKTPEVPVASLLWLPDVLRKAGCAVWEDPGWRSRSHGAMGDVRGVLGHHTAGGGSNDWRVVRDGRTGLAGPLAQLTCERDGSFRVLASGQAWHAGSGGPWLNVPRNAGNAHLIGIEGVSSGRASGDWTKAQLEAYPRGVAALLRHLRMGPDRFLFHTTWAGPRKSDIAGWPGGLEGFRRDIARHLNGSPASSSPPAAPAHPKGLPEMIERPISPSSAPTTGRIICPVGTASATVGKAWFSASFDGGARVEAWFQRAASGSDGPAPGSGKPIDWTLRNAERPWVEVPSGTEFIQYRVTNVEGAGALSVELAAK